MISSKMYLTPLLALTVLSSSLVQAGTIYTTFIEGGGSENTVLATVDPVTGTVSEVGLVGAGRVNSLTYHPDTGMLIGTGENSSGNISLYWIDPLTGIGTEIGELGISHGVTGLAFDSATNRFFASESVSSTEGFGQLHEVDPLTGLATPIGAVQPQSAFSLAYDPVMSEFYFSNGFEDFGAQFGVWDSATGIQSLIGSTATISGMEYDTDADILYGISGAEGPPGLGDKLFIIDPLTGQATLPVTLDRAEFYSSLAVIPIPAPSAAIALAPLALIAARRRGCVTDRSVGPGLGTR